MVRTRRSPSPTRMGSQSPQSDTTESRCGSPQLDEEIESNIIESPVNMAAPIRYVRSEVVAILMKSRCKTLNDLSEITGVSTNTLLEFLPEIAEEKSVTFWKLNDCYKNQILTASPIQQDDNNNSNNEGVYDATEILNSPTRIFKIAREDFVHKAEFIYEIQRLLSDHQQSSDDSGIHFKDLLSQATLPRSLLESGLKLLGDIVLQQPSHWILGKHLRESNADKKRPIHVELLPNKYLRIGNRVYRDQRQMYLGVMQVLSTIEIINYQDLKEKTQLPNVFLRKCLKEVGQVDEQTAWALKKHSSRNKHAKSKAKSKRRVAKEGALLEEEFIQILTRIDNKVVEVFKDTNFMTFEEIAEKIKIPHDLLARSLEQVAVSNENMVELDRDKCESVEAIMTAITESKSSAVRRTLSQYNYEELIDFYIMSAFSNRNDRKDFNELVKETEFTKSLIRGSTKRILKKLPTVWSLSQVRELPTSQEDQDSDNVEILLQQYNEIMAKIDNHVKKMFKNKRHAKLSILQKQTSISPALLQFSLKRFATLDDDLWEAKKFLIDRYSSILSGANNSHGYIGCADVNAMEIDLLKIFQLNPLQRATDLLRQSAIPENLLMMYLKNIADKRSPMYRIYLDDPIEEEIVKLEEELDMKIKSAFGDCKYLKESQIASRSGLDGYLLEKHMKRMCIKSSPMWYVEPIFFHYLKDKLDKDSTNNHDDSQYVSKDLNDYDVVVLESFQNMQYMSFKELKRQTKLKTRVLQQSLERVAMGCHTLFHLASKEQQQIDAEEKREKQNDLREVLNAFNGAESMSLMKIQQKCKLPIDKIKTSLKKICRERRPRWRLESKYWRSLKKCEKDSK